MAHLVQVGSSLMVIGEVLTLPPGAIDRLLDVLESPAVAPSVEDLEDSRDRSCEELVGWYVGEFAARSASLSSRA